MKMNVKSIETLVSIIMPAYNSASTISESIQSVLDQTFKSWELLIIDDQSIDNTIEIVKDFISKDKRINLLALTNNGGLSNARNSGIKIAKGKFLAFLDADDLWSAKKLEAQIELHLQNPNCRISHTNYDFVIEGKIFSRNRSRLFDKFFVKSGKLYPQILYKNNIAILSVMVDRKLIETCKGFDTGLWALEDQDLWIKIAKHNCEFGYLEEKLCYYRINPHGMSNNLGKYKKAYKDFLLKYKEELFFTNKNLLANSVYLNYFGLQFFKRRNFHLAFLYFYKAWLLKTPIHLKAFFLGYLVISFFQMKVALMNKRYSWLL